jgi:hypothetical protein
LPASRQNEVKARHGAKRIFFVSLLIGGSNPPRVAKQLLKS